jgi:anaerobic selenocysteine-containing dehydrogenase
LFLQHPDYPVPQLGAQDWEHELKVFSDYSHAGSTCVIAKGEGKWERISWNEALNTIAEKFKKVMDGWHFP